jgi:GTP-binding protein
MTALRRNDLRNVAIVAHVDHGKTTLVDAMLRQGGAFTEREAENAGERVMDSGDLEREKGITILAKNTAVRYAGPSAPEGMVINIIDTPGHADFGGEVERALSMVDGIVLLVDASEGPLPQTRFVLRKALNQKKPVALVVNKTDRSDSRIDEVVDEAYELFMDLLEDGDEDALDFPVIYASGKAGIASAVKPENGTLPEGDSLEPLFKTILETIPAPVYDEGAPLQAHVTNLDSSPFLGRLALLRIFQGELHKGQTVAWMKGDGTVKNVKITELLVTEGLVRVPGEKAGPGDIVAIAGIPDIMIGETIADAENPIALPLISVDEPAISMTIGTNTSPLAGKVKGAKLTARLVKDRLESELIGNVSLRVLPTPGRSRGVASSRWPSSSSRCVAKASSSPSASRRWSPRTSTARSTSPPSASPSTLPRSTSARSPSSSRTARAAWRACRTTAPAGSAWSSWFRRVASSASVPSS